MFREVTNLGRKTIRTEVKVRVGKRDGKAVGKDKVTGEMVVDWIWRLCNVAFESGVVPEDSRSAVIVPLYKGQGERTECKNYRSINPLSLVREIGSF